MMHLQWHGANGQILDIREPDNVVPDPPYVYLTSSGFGGSGCDVQTVKGPYQHGATFLGALLVPRSLSLTFAIVAQSTEDLYLRRRTVAAAFSPVAGEGRLVWVQGERSFSLRCVVGGASPEFVSGRGSGPTWQTVIVDLIASDPCWFEDEHEQHLQGVTGGLVFRSRSRLIRVRQPDRAIDNRATSSPNGFRSRAGDQPCGYGPSTGE